MSYVIGVDASFDYYFTMVTLDDTAFILTLSWNNRESRWYVEIAKADGTPIRSGVPIVVDTPLFGDCVSVDMPPGWLMAVDGSGDGREIEEKEDLGDRVRLYYLTEDEVAAL